MYHHPAWKHPYICFVFSFGAAVALGFVVAFAGFCVGVIVAVIVGADVSAGVAAAVVCTGVAVGTSICIGFSCPHAAHVLSIAIHNSVQRLHLPASFILSPPIYR